MSFLLSEETKGLYTCVLCDQNGAELHSIGINCTTGYIYDCMNEHVVKLSKDGIQYCVGAQGRGIDSIRVCYEIKEKPSRQRLHNKTTVTL